MILSSSSVYNIYKIFILRTLASASHDANEHRGFCQMRVTLGCRSSIELVQVTLTKWRHASTHRHVIATSDGVFT
jgi:hypothetical protein